MDSVRECPFCLANGLLDGAVLDQDDLCYLVVTGDPVLEASLMVIPHRHVPTPFELTEDEWRSTWYLLARAKRLLDAGQPDGYSIGWNVGEVGGQSIPHAHLHVIGRFADEPLAGQGIRHALKQESNRRPGAASDHPVPENP
jgi:diadenosine tetraphosphate (Ap4A) HIT family hydrolase